MGLRIAQSGCVTIGSYALLPVNSFTGADLFVSSMSFPSFCLLSLPFLHPPLSSLSLPFWLCCASHLFSLSRVLSVSAPDLLIPFVLCSSRICPAFFLSLPSVHPVPVSDSSRTFRVLLIPTLYAPPVAACPVLSQVLGPVPTGRRHYQSIGSYYEPV